MPKHLNITVTGKVQGVFFRAFTKKEAERLQLNGFVYNESNGNVSIEVEGEEAVLHEFITWCKKGSPAAIVKEVKWKEGELKNFKDFQITK